MVKKQYNENYFSLAFNYVLGSRNMDQKQFAEKSGINQSNISGYATGRTSPTFKRIGEIANLLDYDPIEFLAIGRAIKQGNSPENVMVGNTKEELLAVYRENSKLSRKNRELEEENKMLQIQLAQKKEATANMKPWVASPAPGEDSTER